MDHSGNSIAEGPIGVESVAAVADLIGSVAIDVRDPDLVKIRGIRAAALPRPLLDQVGAVEAPGRNVKIESAAADAVLAFEDYRRIYAVEVGDAHVARERAIREIGIRNCGAGAFGAGESVEHGDELRGVVAMRE